MNGKIRINGIKNTKKLIYTVDYEVLYTIINNLSVLEDDVSCLSAISKYKVDTIDYSTDNFVDISLTYDTFREVMTVSSSMNFVLNVDMQRETHFVELSNFPLGDEEHVSHQEGIEYCVSMLTFFIKDVFENPQKFIHGGFAYLDVGSNGKIYRVNWQQLRRERLLKRVNLFKKK